MHTSNSDSAPVLKIHFFGPLRIEIQGEVRPLLTYRKLNALLAYLASQRRRKHNRSELMALLWPEQSEINARQSLRKALHQLRKQLRLEELGISLWHADGDLVEFLENPQVWTDLDEVESAAARVKTHRHTQLSRCPACLANLEAIGEAYRGDFLEGFSLTDNEAFEEWLQPLRLAYHGIAVVSCETLIDACWLTGDQKKNAQLLQNLLFLEPNHELAAIRRLRLLAEAGQYSAAAAFFRQFTARLAADLDLEPGPPLARIGERVRAQRPPGPVNLPPLDRSLIERGRELGWISQQFTTGDEQAVLLTGPRGVGKTTLAIQAARRLSWRFYDGVQLIHASGLTSIDAVIQAIATACQVKFHSSQSAREDLRQYLASRHILLILDACELVGANILNLLEWLRANCPDIALIITSREPILASPSAPIQSIPVQGVSSTQPVASLPLSTLTPFQSAELFTERCLAAQPAFSLDLETGPALVQICHWLNGNPLAIELVAGQAGRVGLTGMLAELPPFISSGGVDLKPILDWIFANLTPAAQRLLSRCGILQGSWPIQAAQAVYGIPPLDPSTLTSLVKQNLVHSAGADRFTLLDTIQEYALEHLRQGGETSEAQTLHLEYYTTQTLHGLSAHTPGFQIADRIAPDLANLRAAIQFATASQRAEQALSILARLWHYWDYRGPFSEYLELAKHAMDAARSPAFLNVCQVSLAQGVFHHYLGHKAESENCFRQALDLARAHHFPHEAARALRALGQVATISGQLDQARALLLEALSAIEQHPDAYLQALVYDGLGVNAVYRGDMIEGDAMLQQALLASAQCPDPVPLLGALTDLASLRNIQRRFPESQELYNRALPLAQQLNDARMQIAIYLGLGTSLRNQGDWQTARQYITRAFQTNLDVRDVRLSIYIIEALVQTLLLQKNCADAAQLYGRAVFLRNEKGFSALRVDEQERHSSWVEQMRHSLGGDTYTSLFAEGANLPEERILSMVDP